MQSCSVHHCVLLLLTLTFTTAPVADAVFPIQAKLHQRVTLPCAKECSGEAKWTLQRNRDVVFARCNQTSCSSVVKGYEMSHDQYLKEDLSLTITAAEYSMRNTYTCECRTIDHAEWRLSIETMISAVQVKHDGDLILDLTVPEPVEVIYTSSDSADGERICNGTQHSLQCKAEYTHRTSLRYPELTLRDVTYSDSGLYTIRDTENKEDIRVYAVSVTGLSKGMTAGIVVLVLLLVLGIIGVIIYKWREAKKKRRAAEEERRAAEEERRAAEEKCRAAEEKCRAAEEKCRAAEEKCRAAQEELSAAQEELSAAQEELSAAQEELSAAQEELSAAQEELSTAQEELSAAEEKLRANKERREVEKQKEAVYEQFKELSKLLQPKNPVLIDQNWIAEKQEHVHKKMKDVDKKLQDVEKMINDLEERYGKNRKYSESIRSFCSKRRRDLKLYRSLYETPDKEYILNVTEKEVRLSAEKVVEVMEMMEQVVKGFEHLSSRKSPDPRNYTLDVMNVNLKMIKYRCQKKRAELNCFKEERGGDEANAKLMIDNMEALLSVLEKWCDDKKKELKKYKPKPGSAERSENQPAESESESEPESESEGFMGKLHQPPPTTHTNIFCDMSV